MRSSGGPSREINSVHAHRLRKLGAQFRRPVWPGDTLVTEGFWSGDRVALQTFAAGRPEPVLTGSWALLAP